MNSLLLICSFHHPQTEFSARVTTILIQRVENAVSERIQKFAFSKKLTVSVLAGATPSELMLSCCSDVISIRAKKRLIYSVLNRLLCCVSVVFLRQPK